MWISKGDIMRFLCCLAFLVCAVSGVPVKTDVNLIDSVYASDTQSVPPSEYVAYYYSSQNEKKHETNSVISDNRIPPATQRTTTSKIFTNLFESRRTEERRPTEPAAPPEGSEHTIPPEPKIEIVYAESMTRSEDFKPATRDKSALETEVHIDGVILSERTEIVTLRPSKNNQYLLVESSHSGNSVPSSTASGSQNSTFNRIPNVFLSADSAIWGGCALVLICSIIIIVLIYSKICRTGPYQE